MFTHFHNPPHPLTAYARLILETYNQNNTVDHSLLPVLCMNSEDFFASSVRYFNQASIHACGCGFFC
jgi:hypothetical protein